MYAAMTTMHVVSKVMEGCSKRHVCYNTHKFTPLYIRIRWQYVYMQVKVGFGAYILYQYYM